MVNFNCPHCNKVLIEKNKNVVSDDIVIKSKLVFLNDDNNVLCRCQGCKKIIALPLSFNGDNKINSKIIDL